MKISLGRKQLTISLQNKLGRPKKTLAREVSFFVHFLHRVWCDNRFAGSKASRVLRRVFEASRIRQLIGLNLAVIGIATGTQLSPAVTEIETPQLEPTTLIITTAKTVQAPFAPATISQYFHQFHPGVDLRAPLGMPVRTVMDGQVENVTYGHYGYGNYVLIDHDNGYESLYAHLSKISVTEGETVDHQTIIGTVGSTGWSTGPHLHLEIWEYKRPINPLSIIQ